MRNIPENNLGYPVLIILATGHSGSGFQLNYKNNIYFVTAKHVLFDNTGKLLSKSAEIVCQTEEINDDTTSKFDINFELLETSNSIYSHTDKDVAAFKIGMIESKGEGKGYTMRTIPGITRKQSGKSNAVVVVNIRLLEDVLVSNDIFLYGYPSSLGLKESPQFDYTKPLLRKGIVASINKNQGTIILDCPVYYGNSGGPVVQVTQNVMQNGIQYKHDVIGVVSQFIPYTENWINQSNNIVHTELSNSGYSVAVAMDYVYEMLPS